MIHRLSQVIAGWIGKQTQNHSVPVIAYGIEIFLNAIIQLSAVLLIAYWLGQLGPSLAVLLSFVILRVVAGGKHLSTFWGCTLADVLLVNGLAWVALAGTKAPALIHGPVLALLTLSTGLAIHRYAPLITVRRPVSHLQVHGRTYSRWVVVVATAIAAACYFVEPAYSMAIILGLAAEAFSITPTGCKALDQLDRWLSSYSFSFKERRESP